MNIPSNGIIIYGDKAYNDVSDLSSNFSSKTREHPTEKGFTGSDTRLEPITVEATINISTMSDTLSSLNALEVSGLNFSSHPRFRYLYEKYKSGESEILITPVQSANVSPDSKESWIEAVISDMSISVEGKRYAELQITFKEVEYAEVEVAEAVVEDTKSEEGGSTNTDDTYVIPASEDAKNSNEPEYNSINKVMSALGDLDYDPSGLRDWEGDETPDQWGPH